MQNILTKWKAFPMYLRLLLNPSQSMIFTIKFSMVLVRNMIQFILQLWTVTPLSHLNTFWSALGIWAMTRVAPSYSYCRATNTKGHGRGQSQGRVHWQNQNNCGGSSSTNQSQSSKPRPLCQICNRVGHLALDCFNRLDLLFQGRQPPKKFQAMATAKHGEATWFTDIGVTNHVVRILATCHFILIILVQTGL